uniref:protein-histidine N-methyltransferase n=1 Tax=Astyanax mexicanus TaxID=7994 RepID=A0A8B9GKH5_ASTMX
SAGKEWEEYVQIRALVEKIRKKQKGVSVVFEGSREDYFPELMSWAAECGASCDGFEISSFADEGYGLKATRDIKAEELFLWIPRKMLMTVESAKNSVLGEFGRIADPEFNLKPHNEIPLTDLCVCVCVCFSLFLPSIPHFSTSFPPFVSPFSSPLSSLLVTFDPQTHPNASKLPLKDAFTFDDYRWAVSSVMTRQNQIPTEDGSRVTLALIPLWDMCNHTNGLITTGYNLEDDRCECVALQDYKENEQIYIFYGTRSNAEFVIHNGFFFEDNAHDRVKIKLGVSKSERLYAMKAEVLARAGIPATNFTFLEIEAHALFKCEDRSILQKPDLSLHSRVAVKLRLAEKEILERAVSSGRNKHLHFQKQLEEGSPLPLYEESDIALLENADAKLPIILRKLDEEDEHAAEAEAHNTLLESAQTPPPPLPLLLNGQSKEEVNGNLEEEEEEEDGSKRLQATAKGKEEASSQREEPSSQRTEDASKDKGE